MLMLIVSCWYVFSIRFNFVMIVVIYVGKFVLKEEILLIEIVYLIKNGRLEVVVVRLF